MFSKIMRMLLISATHLMQKCVPAMHSYDEWIKLYFENLTQLDDKMQSTSAYEL